MEKVKKVVFTVTNDLSYDQRMSRICTTLSEAGFEVELVGRKRGSSVPADPKPYKQTRLRCFFDKGKLFYIEYNIRLFFYLLFNSAFVISSVDLDTLAACFLAAKIRSKKLVFDAHEYFTEVPEVVNRKMVKKIWALVGRAFIPHTDAAYTVGEKLAEIFTDQYKKKFDTIRNVPLASTSHSGTSSSSPVILYQGALNVGRGLEQSIMAMHHIDAELWLAGEGDLSEQLRKLCADQRLSGKVKFLGFVKPGELKAITAKAAIGLNLLENSGLSYYYSLSNKFFDYIHAEVPQVCAPFPEYEQINAQFKVALLCPCSTEKIADTINNLLHDPALYQRLRSACHEARPFFSWENESSKIIDIYHSL